MANNMNINKDLKEIMDLEEEIYTEQFFNIPSSCEDCKKYFTNVNAKNYCDIKDKICPEFRHK